MKAIFDLCRDRFGELTQQISAVVHAAALMSYSREDFSNASQKPRAPSPMAGAVLPSSLVFSDQSAILARTACFLDSHLHNGQWFPANVPRGTDRHQDTERSDSKPHQGIDAIGHQIHVVAI